MEYQALWNLERSPLWHAVDETVWQIVDFPFGTVDSTLTVVRRSLREELGRWAC